VVATAAVQAVVEPVAGFHEIGTYHLTAPIEQP